MGPKPLDAAQDWLKRLIHRTKGDYKAIACPFLGESGRCTIYATRPSCCRNFPNKRGICGFARCDLLQIKAKKNTLSSTKVCDECQYNCCKMIAIPAQEEPTKEFVFKWLNINCDTCKQSK